MRLCLIFYDFYSMGLINSICKDTNVGFFLSYKQYKPLNTPIFMRQHTSPLICNELLYVIYAVKMNEKIKQFKSLYFNTFILLIS